MNKNTIARRCHAALDLHAFAHSNLDPEAAVPFFPFFLDAGHSDPCTSDVQNYIIYIQLYKNILFYIRVRRIIF